MAAIRDPQADVIEAGTLRITWGSAVAAGLASAVIVYNDSFDSIFGDDLAPDQFAWIKGAVLIALILAFTLIAVADMVSRAYATAQKELAAAQSQAVPATNGHQTSLAPEPLQDGYLIAAVRPEAGCPDRTEYLVVRPGDTPTWVSSDNIATYG